MQRTIYSLAIFTALAACAGEVEVEDLDPATTLGDDDWGADGPEPGDEMADATDDGVDIDTSELFAGVPAFQLPFPCGQVWAGQTRTAHSPRLAVDFNRSNDTGDTVVAAASGTVTRVANEGNTSYGRWIEIAHGNGYRTRYAHLSSQLVSVNQKVSRGQTIGRVGSTGGSTGPHLHYEQIRNGSAIAAVFNGRTALYFGTRNYTSQNGCGGGGGGGGGGTVGRVNTAGAPLTIRSAATTNSTALGSVGDGAQVTIKCQKRGQSVKGTYGTSDIWDKIGSGFIADAFVSTGSDGLVAPLCP